MKAALPKAKRDRTAAQIRAMEKWRAAGRPNVHGIRYTAGGGSSTPQGQTQGGGPRGQGGRFTPAQERKLRRALKKGLRGTPLARYIDLFMVQAELSGFDPRFTAAIAAQESAWGRATPSNAPFNFWGWSVNTGQSSSSIASPFQNPETAFRYYGRNFGRNYKGSNLFTDFGPYAADPSWEAKIASIMRRMGGNPYDVRYGPARGRTPA